MKNKTEIMTKHINFKKLTAWAESNLYEYELEKYYHISASFQGKVSTNKDHQEELNYLLQLEKGRNNHESSI